MFSVLSVLSALESLSVIAARIPKRCVVIDCGSKDCTVELETEHGADVYNHEFDGKEGLVFAFLECYWYRFVVDSKIFKYQKKGKDAKFENLKAFH